LGKKQLFGIVPYEMLSRICLAEDTWSKMFGWWTKTGYLDTSHLCNSWWLLATL